MKRLTLKLSIGTLFIFTYLLSITGKGLAASEPGNAIPEPDLPELGALNSIQLIGKVIFFLILIIAMFFILIKLLNKKNQFSGFGRSVRSIGGVPLGQNKSIQIVEIGHSLYVVGVGDNIQLLEKIDDQEEIEYITLLLQNKLAEQTSFPTLVRWLEKLKSGKKNTDVEEEVEMTTSFQQVFNDKLQQATSRNKNVEEWIAEQKQTDRLNDK